MKKIIFFAFLLGIFASCEDNYIDTGIANGKLDVTMWEYMGQDSYNWDSTRLIIERGGLKNYFDGSLGQEITFFGPCNHPIRKWMYDNKYETVEDIPVSDCHDFMERYIVMKRYMREDFDYEVKGTQEGGTIVTKLDGTQIRVFRRKTNWGQMVDRGPEELHVQTFTFSNEIRVASPNIETTTGVVHALSYTHLFSNF